MSIFRPARLRLWLLLLFLALVATGTSAQDVPRVANPFDLRTAEAQAKCVKEHGGTAASEAAVAAGLKWIVQHQKPDGSWSFDHTHGPCKSNPGEMKEAFNGATGLALLPFLGAGQTHKAGQYKETVSAGLAYLVRSMKLKPDSKPPTGNLSEPGGWMYSHGLATLALCEAYALSKDRELLAPSQAAINYIVYAQDPDGGGWRYLAKQSGDTSVTGWQLQALMAGRIAGLEFKEDVFTGAGKFLDSVQADDGAAYGYINPGDAPGTTASGLYSRSLLGWQLKENPPLQRGIQRLTKEKPVPARLYHEYFKIQLLRHHLPEEWKIYNILLRDTLIEQQAFEGAERGSWFYANRDIGADRGGRIYCTSLATLILESPYRTYRAD